MISARQKILPPLRGAVTSLCYMEENITVGYLNRLLVSVFGPVGFEIRIRPQVACSIPGMAVFWCCTWYDPGMARDLPSFDEETDFN